GPCPASRRPARRRTRQARGARTAPDPRRVRVESHGRAHDRLVRVAPPPASRHGPETQGAVGPGRVARPPYRFAHLRSVACGSRRALRRAAFRVAAVPLSLARWAGDGVARGGSDPGGCDSPGRFPLRGWQDGRGALLGLGTVVRAELFFQHARELPTCAELFGDVGAADQLAVDEDLRNGRPARDRGQLPTDGRIRKDVNSREGGARFTQIAQGPVGVPAHHELRRTLHEEGHGLVLDYLLDALAQLGHSLPFVLIRNSWMVPSRRGSARASFTRRCWSRSVSPSKRGLAIVT